MFSFERVDTLLAPTYAMVAHVPTACKPSSFQWLVLHEATRIEGFTSTRRTRPLYLILLTTPRTLRLIFTERAP